MGHVVLLKVLFEVWVISGAVELCFDDKVLAVLKSC